MRCNRKFLSLVLIAALLLPWIPSNPCIAAGPLSISSMSVNGLELVIQFNQELNIDHTPDLISFALKADGRFIGWPAAASLEGSKLKLNLVIPVRVGQQATLTYIPGRWPVEDASGNRLPAFQDMPVSNNTTDTQAPFLIAARINGDKLQLEYNEPLDKVVTPSVLAFPIRVNNSLPKYAKKTGIEGSIVNLVLNKAVAKGDKVSFSFVPLLLPLRDLAGNRAAMIKDQAVTNLTGLDLTAPHLTQAEVNKGAMRLDFDEALDSSSVPAGTDFAIMADGAPLTAPSAVVLNNMQVFLTLPQPVSPGQQVTIGYTPGAQPLKDAAGNAAASFSQYEVQNSTVDDEVPRLTDARVRDQDMDLVYSETLATDSVPGVADYSISVNGQAQSAPSQVSISGQSVRIRLAGPVRSGESVTISYSPGTNSVKDLAGNPAAPLTIQAVVNQTEGPVNLDAPPMDPTVPNDLFAGTAFLYSGSNPVQTGVVPETIEAERVAVARGRVVDRQGTPLAGVCVTVLDHPEFGQTVSRTDGCWDMAVNGGGLLTFNYALAGYPAVQRTEDTPWKDYVVLEDVVLTPYDSVANPVEFGPSCQEQVARGSQVSDGDGSRQNTLLIPAGTTAEMVMPDGQRQTLNAVTVRATEYTVGDSGPAAMPGDLPANVGYTYCVELSVDEAAGAESVEFNQPLIDYVDNFLNFPVGTPVPVGWYDRERQAWIPSENGRVIKILSVDGGTASLDIDGSGTAAGSEALASLGIGQDELVRLAGLYPAGTSLWRYKMTHFTPWDCNWPYGPPADAVAPSVTLKPFSQDAPAQSMSAGLTGSGARVYYNSKYTAASKSSVIIPVIGDKVPPGIQKAYVNISIAGRNYEEAFDPQSGLKYEFTWDGRDSYGRQCNADRKAVIKIGYEYPGKYYSPDDFERSFGRLPGIELAANRTRQTVVLWQRQETYISPSTEKVMLQTHNLGGWTLGMCHSYSAGNSTLYLGNGQVMNADSNNLFEQEIITMPDYEVIDPNSSEPNNYRILQIPNYVTSDSRGNIYISNIISNQVEKMDRSGNKTVFAGNGTAGYSGDGGPATEAQLCSPGGLAFDKKGNLYIADTWNNRIRMVAPDGTISTVAGSGPGLPADKIPSQQTLKDFFDYVEANHEHGYFSVFGFYYWLLKEYEQTPVETEIGDNGPAISSRIISPLGLNISEDGAIYFTEFVRHRVRCISPDGTIDTIIGDGTPANGEGGNRNYWGPAKNGRLFYPFNVSADSNGQIHIFDYCGLSFIDKRGIYLVDRSLAIYEGSMGGGALGSPGPNIAGVEGDGSEPAAGGALAYFGSDGVCYCNYPFACKWLPVIEPYVKGLITSKVAGKYYYGIPYAGFPYAGICAFGQQEPPVKDNETLVPSPGGNEVYVFDQSGRHLRTLNIITGKLVYSFEYDSRGQLSAVEDANKNRITIERDSDGKAAAIVAPNGQRTVLTVNGDGYLASLTDPIGNSTRFEYGAGGLLTSCTDPLGRKASIEYTEAGSVGQASLPGVAPVSFDYSSGLNSQTTTTSSGNLSSSLTTSDQGKGLMNARSVSASGQTRTAIQDASGKTESSNPDGTKISSQVANDEVWGMGKPVVEKSTVSLPSGRTCQITRDTYYEGSNFEDAYEPFNASSVTNRVSMGSRSYENSYNRDQNSITSKTGMGRQTQTILDDQGRVSVMKIPGQEDIAYSYNGNGQISEIRQGSMYKHYGYDLLMRLSEVVDGSGNRVVYHYDECNRLTEVILPEGRQYQYEYDAVGRCTAVTMPNGEEHSFSYAENGGISSYSLPGAGQYSNTYNELGQLESQTSPGNNTISRSFDNAGRTQSIDYGQAQVQFSYNAAGGQISQVSRVAAGSPFGSQSLAYTYDGPLVTGTAWSGAVNAQFGYVYDNSFNLTSLTLDGSPIINCAYDNDGLLTTCGPFAIDRDLSTGRAVAIKDGAMNTVYAYDSMGRLQSRTCTVGGRQVYSMTLAYDSTGRIAGKTENTGNASDEYAYEYDSLNQLIAVNKNGTEVERYSYDVNGNRTSRKTGATEETASYSTGDILTRQGDTAYTFNQDGFMTSRGDMTLEYTAVGELQSVSIVSGSTIQYASDPGGRRIARTQDGVTEEYLYGFSGNPYQLTASRKSGEQTLYYYDSFGFLTAFNRGGQMYYVQTDQVGSPRVITDASGNPIKEMVYDSYGNIVSDSAPSFVIPVGYAGGLQDPATGLIRFGMRDYDPVSGRWCARDPINQVFSGNCPVGGGKKYFNSLSSNPLMYPDEARQWVLDQAQDHLAVFLLEWYFDKDGEVLFIDCNLDEWKWVSSYMRRQTLASGTTLDDRCKEIINSWALQLKPGECEYFDTNVYTYEFEMDNGYWTGAQLLHGANMDMGGFIIDACIRRYMNGNYSYSSTYVWNDIMDVNLQYAISDLPLWFYGQIFTRGQATSYPIVILWSDSGEIIV